MPTKYGKGSEPSDSDKGDTVNPDQADKPATSDPTPGEVPDDETYEDDEADLTDPEQTYVAYSDPESSDEGLTRVTAAEYAEKEKKGEV